MGAPLKGDRELAAEVRRLSLNKIKAILERPMVEMNQSDKELHDAILLKLASTVLPRINEVTGENGAPLQLSFDQSFNPNGTTSEAKGDNTEQSKIQDSESGTQGGQDSNGSGESVLQSDSLGTEA